MKVRQRGCGPSFSTGPSAAYDDERNRPDHAGTSHLSLYLKWGCIHPRTLLADLAPLRNAGATSYRRELAFREFYADQLFHRPDLPQVSADPAIDQLAWDQGKEADERLAAWKAGRTGYPYIDAGMRQLLAEGWIHNRVRMAVASFLIKDLHLAWQLGAAHFLDHLVDGDSRPTPTAGSGSPAPGRRPRRTTGSSTRSVRARSSTRTAITSAGTCQNWRTSKARPCTGRGTCPTVFRPATSSPSSTTRPNGLRRFAGGSNAPADPGYWR